MSQPKISASSTAVWSFAPAAATASKSECSIRPRTVRLRSSSGFCSTSALRPEGSRDTLSVWLSLSRRSSPKSSPSLWVKTQRLPRAQAVEARLQAGQTAERGEVGEVELQASEDAVQGVVTGDDHVDGREREARFGEPGGRGQLRGRRI